MAAAAAVAAEEDAVAVADEWCSNLACVFNVLASIASARADAALSARSCCVLSSHAAATAITDGITQAAEEF